MSVVRSWGVRLHRWVGLSIAVFLIVAGATGTILAFQEELDRYLNPDLFYALPSTEQAMSPLQLKQHVEQVLLGGKAVVDYLPLHYEEGENVQLWITPQLSGSTGESFELPFDTIFVDPFSGQLRGQRMWGEFRLDRAHLIPLIYKVHYSLALPAPWGTWFMGVVAILWFFDCFVGLYLTLPQGRGKFLKRWFSFWRVKWEASAFRKIFDVHRAVGLWLWVVLLMFAASAVMFNLHREVYLPVVRALLAYNDLRVATDPLDKAIETPLLSYAEALERGRSEMRIEAKRLGFSITEERSLSLNREFGVFIYRVKSSLDLPKSYEQTGVYLDAVTGSSKGFFAPSVDSGQALSTWLAVLHMGKVWGLPYRIFVSLAGLLIVGLAGTGVAIWFKKRKFTQKMNGRRKQSSREETRLAA